MRSVLAIAALIASVTAIAQTQVPYVFEDGTPAAAADVNENFDTLESAIDSNDEDFELFRADTELALPPSNCLTEQIIKWNGSAWVCSDLLGRPVHRARKVIREILVRRVRLAPQGPGRHWTDRCYGRTRCERRYRRHRTTRTCGC